MHIEADNAAWLMRRVSVKLALDLIPLVTRSDAIADLAPMLMCGVVLSDALFTQPRERVMDPVLYRFFARMLTSESKPIVHANEGTGPCDAIHGSCDRCVVTNARTFVRNVLSLIRKFAPLYVVLTLRELHASRRLSMRHVRDLVLVSVQLSTATLIASSVMCIRPALTRTRALLAFTVSVAPLFRWSSDTRRELLWRYCATTFIVYVIQREFGEPTRVWGVPALFAVIACVHRHRAMGKLGAVSYTARACFM
jgi:hypothetical protein